MKAQENKRSDSGQLLADAKKYIAELQTRLVDAMCARDEYEDVRLDDQNQIFELQTQLRDALCARYESEKLRANDQNDIAELKRQLADALTTIEELKADIKRKVCTTNTYMDVYKCTHIEYRHTHAHKLPMCARTCTYAHIICIYIFACAHMHTYIHTYITEIL